jgi:capsular exopolysaccharide synthesis family protein
MTLNDFFRVLHHRKWWVLLVVALAIGGFLGRELTKPHLYRASSQVLLNNQSAASLVGLQPSVSSDAADRFAETQKSLARVPEVAARTLAAAGVKDTPQHFLDNSSVTALPDEDVLEFSVTARSPALAMKLATEYGRQFPIYRRQLDTTSLQQALKEVQAQLARARLLSGTDSPLYKSLKVRLQQLNTLAALQTTSAQLVRPADGTRVVQPRPMRAGFIGLALGLLAGIALALIRHATDTRFESAHEVADALGLPLLARIPPPPRGVRTIVSMERPKSVEAEAYRMLRTNLEFTTLEREATTIMVTSATAGEGKSTTTANLAVALARTGKRVTVVDLDLRQPGISRLFAAKNTPGITDVVRKGTTIDSAMHLVLNGTGPSQRLLETATTGVGPTLAGGSLHFIGTGLLPPNPGEFIASHAFADILEDLKASSDVVLIDAAPLLTVADTMALTDQVDAIVLVVRMGNARRPLISEIKRVLEDSRARVLGVAITGAPAVPGYGYYGQDSAYRNAHSGRSSIESEV